MADVRPFRALRYTADAGPLGDLVAPPYDVISPEERRRLLATSAYNSVRLILPEVDYEEVGGLIAGWTRAGVLAADDEPVLIAWTQAFTLADGVPRERRTLLGTVGLEPYRNRVVRPHERTHAGPREDRLRLTRAVRANLSPVFGLYPDPGGSAWAAAAVSGPPHAELTDAEGTVHRIWVLRDAAVAAAVGAAMRDRWILIADGHHRYETALAYREEMTARVGGGGGDAPWNRVLMGLTALDDPGLVVLPTHRLLARWPDGAAAAFDARPVDDLDALRAALADAPADAPALGLVRPDGAALLTARAETGAPPSARLDVAVLESRILVPDLGADQAQLAHDGELTYTKDAEEGWRLVRGGELAAALLMRPIPKADIAAVSDEGGTMPQKSTYFFPKLLTGIAFHPLH